MQGYNRDAAARARTARGISKISVQTGTSHGGVVLADGSIADVKLDLQALAALSKAAREEYGLAGRGAARRQHAPLQRVRQFPPDRDRRDPPRHQLPEHRLRSSQAARPICATGCAAGWTRTPRASARRATPPSSSTTRPGRRPSGRSSASCGRCREEVRGAIAADLERTFAFLFEQLNVNGTEKDINRFVQAPMQHHAALKPALVAAEDDPDAGE